MDINAYPSIYNNRLQILCKALLLGKCIKFSVWFQHRVSVIEIHQNIHVIVYSARTDDVSASEPPEVLPLSFSPVISEMHKTILENYISLVIAVWFRWKCIGGDIPYSRQNYKISNKKQPRSLADDGVNLEPDLNIDYFTA